MHLLTDLHTRIGNHLIGTGAQLEETMHVRPIEFEEAYQFASHPQYVRVLSPTPQPFFYYGCAKSQSAGRRVRLLEGLEMSVGAFPGSRVAFRGTCNEGDTYDGEDRCHNDLALAGADYNSCWSALVSTLPGRRRPREEAVTIPTATSLFGLGSGNSWANITRSGRCGSTKTRVRASAS